MIEEEEETFLDNYLEEEEEEELQEEEEEDLPDDYLDEEEEEELQDGNENEEEEIREHESEVELSEEEGDGTPPVPENVNNEEDKSEEEDELEHYIAGTRIIESRDPLSLRKDNLLFFLNSDGKPCEEQGQSLSKSLILPKFSKGELGSVKYFKKRLKFHFGLVVQDNLYQGKESAWNLITQGFKKLKSLVVKYEISSLSIPKVSKLYEFDWQKVFQELAIIFSRVNCKITICLGIVTTPTLSERHDIMVECHESTVTGHKGVTKTYHRIRANYYWSNMKDDIQYFIQQCLQCKLKKLTRVPTRQPMAITDTPGTSFEKCAMDLVGPFPVTSNGNKYILTLQDLLTKYTIAVPIPDQSASTTAEALVNHMICIFGTPKAVLSDQGRNFISALLKHVAKLFHIKQYRTTAFNPKSNGSLERSHQILVDFIKQFVTSNEEWDRWLNLYMFSYNTSVHKATKRTPHELVFGRTATLPSSRNLPKQEQLPTYDEYLIELMAKLHHLREIARNNLIQAKHKSKEQYDKKAHPREFTAGNYVFLKVGNKNNKLSNHFTGPHKIVEVLDQKRIIISVKNKNKTVCADRLKHSYIEDDQEEFSD